MYVDEKDPLQCRVASGAYARLAYSFHQNNMPLMEAAFVGLARRYRELSLSDIAFKGESWPEP